MTKASNAKRICLAAAVVLLAVGLGCSTDSPTAPQQTPAPPAGTDVSAAWKITIEVNPDEIAQGSTEPARVTVKAVRADDGTPPGQGTTIVVSASLGEFVSLGSGLTQVVLALTNGRAETLFFPGTIEGTAVITAQLEASAGQAGVRIREGLVAAFEFVNGGPSLGGSENLSVQFINRSTGDPRRFFWDFGDGRSSREENPIHIYDTPGDYVVRLRIEKGSFSAENTQVLLVREPIFITDITPNFGPAGTRVTIRGQGFIRPLRVRFDDVTADVTFVSGTRTSLGAIVPIFSEDDFDKGPCTTVDDTGMTVDGEIAVDTLVDVTVETLDLVAVGGQDTLIQSFAIVPIEPECVAMGSGSGSSGGVAAAFGSSCTGLSCTFTDGSTPPSGGTIVSYLWDFGDGGSSIAPSPAYTYGAAGTYSVSLSVTGSDGSFDTSTQQVTVN